MDGNLLSQSPFAVVTFIVAPAMLTNASSVLAMSTINRMLRTRDRMSELYTKSESGSLTDQESAHLIVQVGRAESQALMLLRGLRAIYVALGAFAAATLVTLLAAVTEQTHVPTWFRPLTVLSIALGVIGVGGLIFSTINLFRATRLSLANISEEAAMIRERQSRRTSASSAEGNC
jgi:hypothetical protein